MEAKQLRSMCAASGMCVGVSGAENRDSDRERAVTSLANSTNDACQRSFDMRQSNGTEVRHICRLLALPKD